MYIFHATSKASLNRGFAVSNGTDSGMAALICCNSVPYHWYGHTWTG